MVRWLTDEGEDGEDNREAGAGGEGGVDGRVENSGGRDGGGEQDLGGEDTVDLADEAPSELGLAAGKARVQRAPPSLQVAILPLLHPRVPPAVHLPPLSHSDLPSPSLWI